jgi:hypothetical protein
MNHYLIQKCQYGRNKKGQGHLHMVHSIVNLVEQEKVFSK